MKTTWSEFSNAVVHAGLHPKNCPASGCDHWQIIGGKQLVNVWPATKRGFRMAAGNGRGRPGTIAKAIKLAGPPEVPKPPASVPENSPREEEQHIPWQRETRVGLLRWLWRLIW